MMLLIALTACKHVEPAPADTEGAAKWLYANYDEGDAAGIADAVDKISDDLDAGSISDAIETTMTPLSADAVATVDRVAVESLDEDAQADVTDDQLDSGEFVRLADQQGMLIVTVIHCSLADVEELLAMPDQNTLHGGYDAYERTWDADGDSYFAGETDRFTWSTDYTISTLGATYEANIHGGLRHVAAEDDDAFRFGDMVLGRAVLPEPATFTAGGDYFRQDYQLDLIWERAQGETVHLFGVWRDMELSGIKSSNGAYISVVSDRSVESDGEIEDACSAGS
jgi:hypothetical protein